MVPDNQSIQMKRSKAPDSKIISQRIAAKMASRKSDRQRLDGGESPEVLQRENSIFSADFFKNGRFSNLASVIGK